MKFDFSKQSGLERLKNRENSFLMRLKETTRVLRNKLNQSIYNPATERSRVQNRSTLKQNGIRPSDSIYVPKQAEVSQLKTKRVIEMSKYLEFGRSSRRKSKDVKPISFVKDNRTQLKTSFHDNIQKAKEMVHQTRKKNLNKSIIENKKTHFNNQYKPRNVNVPKLVLKKKEAHELRPLCTRRVDQRMVMGRVKPMKNIAEKFKQASKRRHVVPVLRKGHRVVVMK